MKTLMLLLAFTFPIADNPLDGFFVIEQGICKFGEELRLPCQKLIKAGDTSDYLAVYDEKGLVVILRLGEKNEIVWRRGQKNL